MKTELTGTILAVITTDMELVKGSAPTFYAENDTEKEKMALYLARVTKGMVHDVGNGVYIIIKH